METENDGLNKLKKEKKKMKFGWCKCENPVFQLQNEPMLCVTCNFQNEILQLNSNCSVFYAFKMSCHRNFQME